VASWDYQYITITTPMTKHRFTVKQPVNIETEIYLNKDDGSNNNDGGEEKAADVDDEKKMIIIFVIIIIIINL